MNDPGNIGPNNKRIGDASIEELISSEDPDLHQMGLVYLDWKFREAIGGLLENWSKRLDWRLEDADIAKIWEATLTSISKFARSERFRKTGNLNGLVSMSARWRAVDFLRHRLPIDRGVDVQELDITSGDEYHDTLDPEKLENIQARFDKLRPIELRVITSKLLSFLASGCTKWPSLKQLVVLINEDGGPVLSQYKIQLSLESATKTLSEEADGEGEIK